MHRTVVEAYLSQGSARQKLCLVCCTQIAVISTAENTTYILLGCLESRDHLLVLVFVWQRLWSVPSLSICIAEPQLVPPFWVSTVQRLCLLPGLWVS
jgi:hypothetical protein